jgi:hypothetical protein
MNSLKASITTLENMVGSFFSPKGMTVYCYDPHSIEKLVLCLSSRALLI